MINAADITIKILDWFLLRRKPYFFKNYVLFTLVMFACKSPHGEGLIEFFVNAFGK